MHAHRVEAERAPFAREAQPEGLREAHRPEDEARRAPRRRCVQPQAARPAPRLVEDRDLRGRLRTVLEAERVRLAGVGRLERLAPEVPGSFGDDLQDGHAVGRGLARVGLARRAHAVPPEVPAAGEAEREARVADEVRLRLRRPRDRRRKVVLRRGLQDDPRKVRLARRRVEVEADRARARLLDLEEVCLLLPVRRRERMARKARVRRAVQAEPEIEGAAGRDARLDLQAEEAGERRLEAGNRELPARRPRPGREAEEFEAALLPDLGRDAPRLPAGEVFVDPGRQHAVE